MDIRKPTVHNMKRRSHSHDYRRSGYYHITISTAKALHQPLGHIAGRLDKPDGDSDAPHVVLSPLGRMVEQELRGSIQRHYPMLEVMEYIVMPEHIHFLLVAHRDIVSKNGKPTHLGLVIAGFKYGCNKRYWAMTGRGAPTNNGEAPAAEPLGTRKDGGNTVEAPAAEPLGTRKDGENNGEAPAAEPPGTRKDGGNTGEAPAAKPLGTRKDGGNTGEAPAAKPLGTRKDGGSVLGGLGGKTGTEAKIEAPPLFDGGYCDVMPIDESQLATQLAYIRANPRSRLLRTTNRQWLQPQRHTVNTAVSLRALKGYLQRECPRQMTPDSFAAITLRLQQEDGYVVCDSYGDVGLLDRKLLPVVCHRKDAALFEQQKTLCLSEAASGAVLVSACISQSEQNIMKSASAMGFPVVIIEDNGFPDIYHPSVQRIDDCASGRLQLLTPWIYQFRSHTENITELVCKTMNCIAQAVCREKDDWWKREYNP